jgi:eukaryotic-like serine/threonine-protein kinase
MACLDENEIAEFLAPGRADRVVFRVEGHIAECATCRQLLMKVSETSTKVIRAAGTDTVVLGPPPKGHPWIGKVVHEKWTIERFLGAGGMALVFAARHRNGKRVAIKCMRPNLVLSPDLVERFKREGYLANAIDHPGVVTVLDDDRMEDGTPFLVMELLTGASLEGLLEREGPLPVARAVDLVLEALDVVAAAHERGIVHRDLKPENLFLTDEGRVKILDFGIARLRERATESGATEPGTTMGTVGFMAPEQARGHTAEVDAQSDVWSMGATLYRLLTGKSLHEAKTVNEGLLLAMTRNVEPMASLAPTLVRSIGRVLDQALAFEKSERFPSARAMIDALGTARAEAEIGRFDATSSPPKALYMRESAPPPSLVSSVASVAVPLSSEGSAAIRPEGRARKPIALVIGLVVLCGAALTVNPFFRDRPGEGKAASNPESTPMHAPESGVLMEGYTPRAEGRAALAPSADPAAASGLVPAAKTAESSKTDAGSASAKSAQKPMVIDPLGARH